MHLEKGNFEKSDFEVLVEGGDGGDGMVDDGGGKFEGGGWLFGGGGGILGATHLSVHLPIFLMDFKNGSCENRKGDVEVKGSQGSKFTFAETNQLEQQLNSFLQQVKIRKMEAVCQCHLLLMSQNMVAARIKDLYQALDTACCVGSDETLILAELESRGARIMIRLKIMLRLEMIFS
ncbi:hypothetical protein Tco_0058897 [Tanacetum coccineum]